MKIVGVDHATVHAGIAYLNNGEFMGTEALDLRIYDNESPMHAMFNIVTGYICEYSPDCIALEKPMALRNGKIARQLIEVYAACKLASEVNKVPVREITPQLAKMYTAGHAGADKDDVARALEARFGLKFDDIAVPVFYKDKKRKGQIKERLYDVSDACALAVAAYEIIKKEQGGVAI